MKGLNNWFKGNWVIGGIGLIGVIFFWKVIFLGLVPMPGDIVTGLYYPWLDEKWGNAVGVAVKNSLMSDVPSLIYPWRSLAVDLMKNGEWPLWNQYSFGGSSLLGNWQSAVLGPGSWLMMVTHQSVHHWGWSMGVMLQPLLGVGFMYMWLRSKGLKSLAAGLGGIMFAFNGFQVTWMYYNTHGWVVVWLPLMLMAVDKISEGSAKQNLRWGWGLAMLIALAVLGGYPILLAYEGLVVALYGIWKMKDVGKNFKYQISNFKQIIKFQNVKNYSVVCLTLGLAVICGLGLSAIQWLPGWEVIGNSIHAVDRSTLDAAGQGYWPWQNLITLIAPDFFGNPTTGNYWGVGYYDNLAAYGSVVGLVLAVFGWLVVKEGRFWLVIAGLGLVMATNNGLGNLIRENLGLGQSIPARAMWLVSVGMAVGAGYGMEKLLQVKKLREWVGLMILMVSLVVVLGGLWWMTMRPLGFRDAKIFTHCADTYESQWGKRLVCSVQPGILKMEDLDKYVSVAKRNLIIPTGIAGALVVVLLFYCFIFNKTDGNSNIEIRNPKQIRNQKSKIQKIITPDLLSVVCCQLLLLLIIVDLFRYGWKYLPFTPREYLYPQTEVLEWLEEQKGKSAPFRVEFGETVPANMWIPYKLESPVGYDALMPRRYSQFLEAIIADKLSEGVSRFPSLWRFDSQLFPLTNVKYVAALKYDESFKVSAEGNRLKEIYEKDYLVPVYEHGSVRVLENKKFLERAFVVENWETIQDDRELIEKMVGEGMDLREVVVFDENSKFQNSNVKQSSNSKIQNSKNEEGVKWIKSEGQSRELKVNAVRPGYLVLLENWDEGWQGEVNGKRLEPRRADFTFMAVPVEVGENNVKLWYWPESFGWGLGVSGISLVGWLIGGWLIKRGLKKSFKE